jgi:hypothetical protein
MSIRTEGPYGPPPPPPSGVFESLLARKVCLLSSLFLVVLIPACTPEPPVDRTPTESAQSTPLPPTPAPIGALALVGHDPLYARGMNAGLAMWGNHAYVGSRTDGADEHRHPGVLVVSIRDPSHPTVVGEIGPPNEGNPGETSRELRIWPDEHLLLVLNFGCDPSGHDCAARSITPTVRFYDIAGPHARDPELVSTYEPSRTPHELYLWKDPNDLERALLFMSTPGTSDALLVTDISGARKGRFVELASWTAHFPDGGADPDLHSLSVSADGTVAYLAYLTNGFFMVDTSEIARGDPHPRVRALTPLADRLRWAGWGAHSAVPIPGRRLVLTTDEVYGSSEPAGGCPWGWARLIDVVDASDPVVVGQYRVLPYNDPVRCGGVSDERDAGSSFSSHDPTVTEHLAFVAWHSAGLQVFSTANPARPVQVAEFVPRPLRSVATEDPLLSSGVDKVVMWSYPIIQDGLIYVVDIRNGLYVLRYDGPFRHEVNSARFLEGNSNIADEGY